jgi:phospholipid-binding lipoprotein MlaA
MQKNPTTLEKAKREVANASKALASIQEANKWDKVWNEHVFQSESAAADLVDKCEKKLAELRSVPGSSSWCGRYIPRAILPIVAVLLLQNIVLGCATIPADNGCATTTLQPVDEDFDDFGIAEKPMRRDPLRAYNHAMFYANDKIYVWLLRPVAKVYSTIVPRPVRLSVHRCGKNLAFPARFVNNGLQGKFQAAGTELARFGINSTVGILGLFDPADSVFDLRPSEEDFGQTLGRYGVGEGFPLVLPLLGATNLRDALGMIPDGLLHPLSYVDSAEWTIGIRSYEEENYMSLHLEEYDVIRDNAMDLYTLMMDANRQKREADIKE